MYKLLFSVFLLGAVIPCFAQQIHTVSNNPKIPAQFTSLPEAVDAAAPGDILYIHPGDLPYDGADSLVLNKPLQFYGGDFKNRPQEFAGLSTRLNNLVLTPAASGSVVAGIKLERVHIRQGESSQPVNNITLAYNSIERVDFYNSENFTSDSLVIRNNIIRLVFFNEWYTTGPDAEISFENNVIGQVAEGGGTGVVIRNNLFAPSLYATSALENISDAVIANNLFWGDSLHYSMGTGTLNSCILDHNLAFRTTDGFAGGIDNSFGNANQRTLASEAVVQRILGRLLRPENVWISTLLPTADSPLLAAGSDGSDIGLTGGRFPWEPRKRVPLPHVQAVQINNPVLGENTLLEFTINGSWPE